MREHGSLAKPCLHERPHTLLLTMSIKQLNATYDALEDRVLFRLTTQDDNEYRLWLTRAVVRHILILTTHATVSELKKIHPLQHVDAIAEFNQQVKQENTKFTDFEPAHQHPLGEEPVLVQKALIKASEKAYVLELQMKGNQTMKIPLNEALNGQLQVVLKTISERANWNIQPVGDTEQQVEKEASSSPSTDTNHPKLLH